MAEEEFKSDECRTEASMNQGLSHDYGSQKENSYLQGTDNEVSPNQSVNLTDYEFSADVDSQLMKVIQERDIITLAYAKLRKTLLAEREQFEKCKERLFSALNDEKVKKAVEALKTKFFLNEFDSALKNDFLLKEKEDQSEQLEILRTEFKKKVEQTKELETCLERKGTEAVNLENDLAKMHAELEKKKLEVRSFRDECIIKAVAEEQLKARIDKLERELSVTEQTAGRLAEQFKIAEEENKHAENLENQLKLISGELEKKTEQLSTLRDECVKKAAAEEQLKVEINKLKGDLETVQEKFTKEQEAATELAKKVETLSEELLEKKNAEECIEMLEVKLNTVREKRKAAEKLAEQLSMLSEKKEEQLKVLKCKYEEVCKRLVKKEEEVSSLRNEHAEKFSANKDNMKMLETELKTAKEAVITEQNANKKLKKELTTLSNIKEKQLEFLKVKCKESLAEVTQKGKEKRVAEERTNARIKSLEEELKTAKEITVTQRKAAENVQAELKKKDEELAELKHDLCKAQESLKGVEKLVKHGMRRTVKKKRVAVKLRRLGPKEDSWRVVKEENSPLMPPKSSRALHFASPSEDESRKTPRTQRISHNRTPTFSVKLRSVRVRLTPLKFSPSKSVHLRARLGPKEDSWRVVKEENSPLMPPKSSRELHFESSSDAESRKSPRTQRISHNRTPTFSVKLRSVRVRLTPLKFSPSKSVHLRARRILKRRRLYSPTS